MGPAERPHDRVNDGPVGSVGGSHRSSVAAAYTEEPHPLLGRQPASWHPGDDDPGAGTTDTGIVFRRTDIAGANSLIAASWQNIAEMPYCSALTTGAGVVVATVEHLMAALAGAAIDNLLVEVNGPELPIMDGSASAVLFLTECAGIIEQDAPRRAIEIIGA